MEKLQLRNDSEEEFETVSRIADAIYKLTTTYSEEKGPDTSPMGMLAADELVRKCRNAAHQIAPYYEAMLKQSGLLQPDGSVDNSTRNVVLSMVHGTPPDTYILQPLKEPSEEAEQQDIEEVEALLEEEGIAPQQLQGRGPRSKKPSGPA